MFKLAKGHAKDVVVKLDDENGTIRTLAEVTSVGIQTDDGVVDVTAFGDSNGEFIRGVNRWGIELEGIWEPTDDNYLNNLRDGGTASIELYPQGTASGKVKISGDVLMTGYNPNAGLDGAVLYGASFQGSGALSFGTV